MGGFFNELKRRNVVRVGIAYVVLAWVLIQVADVLLPTFGASEGFLKGFYILLGLLFPLVLFFSWAFEVTPEGIKKTREVDESKSITHGTGQKINKMIAGGLVLALGFIVYQNFIAGPDRNVQEAEASSASIAVLPFVNMSSDPEQEYFSDGISEELLNLLAKIPELSVAGRTSSFAFKGKNQDLREIGNTLGVAFLLEGSVRKQGDTVRITAQLIRASDGIHLWSETYDRSLDDVFAIQDEISGAIVGELQTRILGTISAPIVQAQKVNAEAHSLYLLGLQRQNMASSQPYLDAREYFQQALEIAPDYLDALFGLGFVLDDLGGFGTIDDAEAIIGIQDVLGRVQDLGAGDDPKALILEAHLEHFNGNHDKESELALEAYAANPNHTRTVFEAATAYARNNNEAKAIEILQKGLKRDPLSLTLLTYLANAQSSLGKWTETEATINRILEIDPTFAEGFFQLSQLHLRKGEMAEALKQMARIREFDPIDPDIPALLALFLLFSGFTDEAEDYLDEADAMSPNEVYSIALRSYVMAAKGEYNTAAVMAESLLLSDRPGRLGSHDHALLAATHAFSNTGQYERLKTLILAHEPNLARPLDEFRHEDDTVRGLNHMIGHADELARALIGLGREDEAKALLEVAIETYKDINADADTTVTLVPYLVLLGQYDEAVKRMAMPENIFVNFLFRVDPIISGLADPLEGHPGFVALMADMDPLIEAEQAKVRAWLNEQNAE